MPIKPGGFDVARGKTSFCEAARNNAQSHDTADYVQQMQSRDAEKCCAKKRRTPGILKQAHTVVEQTKPFADVQAGENDAQEDRGPKKASRLAFIPGLGGIDR